MKWLALGTSALISLIWAGAASAANQINRDLVFEARIVDGVSDRVIENGRVVLRDDIIVCVGERPQCAVPRGALIIGGDLTVMPGLIDLHTHPKAHYLGHFLASGVTTLRTANTDQQDFEDLLAQGDDHTEVVWAGPMVDGANSFMKLFYDDAADPNGPIRPLSDDHMHGIGVIVAQTPEQAISAMDGLAENGLTWTKFYEQIPLDAFRAGVARAKHHGIRVMADLGMIFTRGLTGAEVDLMQAVEAGIDTLEHASGAALAYQRMGGDLSAMTPDPVLIDRMARAIVDHGVTLVPTLSVYHTYDTIEQAQAAMSELPMGAATGAVNDSLNGMWRYHYRDGPKPKTSMTDIDLVEPLVRRVVELGGKVAVGSDTPAGTFNPPGGGVHKEMEWLVALGFSPLQAIRAATGTAAEVLDRDDIGVLAEGRRANLLVVRGNPAEDIRATRQIQYVVRHGNVYDASALRRRAEEEGNRLYIARFGDPEAEATGN